MIKYLDTEFRENEYKQLLVMLKSRGRDLLQQMIQADELRLKQVGDQVTFIRNQNINFSNICYIGCKFCAFAAHEGSEHAYRMDDDELIHHAKLSSERKVSEICSTAGLDPKSNLDRYRNVLRTFTKYAPGVHIHAFSPFEILYLAEIEDQTYDFILDELKSAGLETLCGTAAEILDPEVRKELCPAKMTAERWIEIIKIAHSKGIRSTSTMMYGHIDQPHNLAKHLLILRGIQEETGGFTEFIPLPFIHQNTWIYKSGQARAGSTGMEDMAVLSAARLYFGDIIPNIQSSWVKTGMKFATLALSAGVNDLGGTLFEERISKFAGATHGVYQSEAEFVRFIQDANRIPVRRNTLYQHVESYPTKEELNNNKQNRSIILDMK